MNSQVNEHLRALIYEEGKLSVVDQLKLPTTLEYFSISSVEEAYQAIRTMKVRGAPLIALVACLGLSVHISVAKKDFKSIDEGKEFILKSIDRLRQSRPTAVNLFTATDELRNIVAKSYAESTQGINSLCENIRLASEHMLEKDLNDNIKMGHYGAKKILELARKDKVRVLTICNTGSLACGGYGTALGVVRALHDLGRLDQVYALETRPYNQGSRLTAFEIVQDKLPGTLIADSMAASLMSSRDIDCVVVGADRVAANGDTANKIGTLQLAILANHFDVPFFVALPTTSLDLESPSGNSVHVEERPSCELTTIFGHKIAPDGIDVWNPAFDITPCSLIGGIITELGVAEAKKGSGGVIDMRAFVMDSLKSSENESYLRMKNEDTAQLSSMQVGYRKLTTDEVVTYLLAIPKMRGILGFGENQTSNTECQELRREVQISEVGDGNLNLVYIVSGRSGTLVVKQALPYVRCVGESWPLTSDRADFEQAALSEERKWDANHVPEVYHFDRKLSLFVMEYIPPPHTVLRKLLISCNEEDEKPLTFADDLSTFLANTLFHTSPLAMGGKEFRDNVSKWSANTAMCSLTEQVIFSDPYNVAEYNRHNSPFLDEYATAIRTDNKLKAAVFEMKEKFLCCTQALLHGDLHSGSIMSTKNSSFVIDSEFAFYGPMGFDTGLLLANLIFAYLSQAGRNKSKQGYSEWILEQTIHLFQEFRRKFYVLWDEQELIAAEKGGISELLRASPSPSSTHSRDLKDSFMNGVWRDTLGFAGAELIRRIIGIAHVEDLDGIEDPLTRSLCEKRCLLVARAFMLYATGIETSDVLPAVKEPTDLTSFFDILNNLDMMETKFV